jgi:hypothetical protein
MKTNILSLTFRKVAATNEAPAYLAGELRVDGELVGQRYVVDVRRLASALVRNGIHEGFRSWIEGDIISIEGNLPKGVACSWKLSAPQAKKAVADALRSVEPVAAAMWGKDGYPISPEGLDAEDLKLAIGALS